MIFRSKLARKNTLFSQNQAIIIRISPITYSTCIKSSPNVSQPPSPAPPPLHCAFSSQPAFLNPHRYLGPPKYPSPIHLPGSVAPEMIRGPPVYLASVTPIDIYITFISLDPYYIQKSYHNTHHFPLIIPIPSLSFLCFLRIPFPLPTPQHLPVLYPLPNFRSVRERGGTYLLLP